MNSNSLHQGQDSARKDGHIVPIYGRLDQVFTLLPAAVQLLLLPTAKSMTWLTQIITWSISRLPYNYSRSAVHWLNQLLTLGLKHRTLCYHSASQRLKDFLLSSSCEDTVEGKNAVPRQLAAGSDARIAARGQI